MVEGGRQRLETSGPLRAADSRLSDIRPRVLLQLGLNYNILTVPLTHVFQSLSIFHQLSRMVVEIFLCSS